MRVVTAALLLCFALALPSDHSQDDFVEESMTTLATGPCGGNGQRLCETGDACRPWRTPDLAGAKCVKCGGNNQPRCASGDACRSEWLTDIDGTCVRCGRRDRPGCCTSSTDPDCSPCKSWRLLLQDDICVQCGRNDGPGCDCTQTTDPSCSTCRGWRAIEDGFCVRCGRDDEPGCDCGSTTNPAWTSSCSTCRGWRHLQNGVCVRCGRTNEPACEKVDCTSSSDPYCSPCKGSRVPDEEGVCVRCGGSTGVSCTPPTPPPTSPPTPPPLALPAAISFAQTGNTNSEPPPEGWHTMLVDGDATSAQATIDTSCGNVQVALTGMSNTRTYVSEVNVHSQDAGLEYALAGALLQNTIFDNTPNGAEMVVTVSGLDSATEHNFVTLHHDNLLSGGNPQPLQAEIEVSYTGGTLQPTDSGIHTGTQTSGANNPSSGVLQFSQDITPDGNGEVTFKVKKTGNTGGPPEEVAHANLNGIIITCQPHAYFNFAQNNPGETTPTDKTYDGSDDISCGGTLSACSQPFGWHTMLIPGDDASYESASIQTSCGTDVQVSITGQSATRTYSDSVNVVSQDARLEHALAGHLLLTAIGDEMTITVSGLDNAVEHNFVTLHHDNLQNFGTTENCNYSPGGPPCPVDYQATIEVSYTKGSFTDSGMHTGTQVSGGNSPPSQVLRFSQDVTPDNGEVTFKVKKTGNTNDNQAAVSHANLNGIMITCPPPPPPTPPPTLDPAVDVCTVDPRCVIPGGTWRKWNTGTGTSGGYCHSDGTYAGTTNGGVPSSPTPNCVTTVENGVCDLRDKGKQCQTGAPGQTLKFHVHDGAGACSGSDSRQLINWGYGSEPPTTHRVYAKCQVEAYHNTDECVWSVVLPGSDDSSSQNIPTSGVTTLDTCSKQNACVSFSISDYDPSNSPSDITVCMMLDYERDGCAKTGEVDYSYAIVEDNGVFHATTKLETCP